MPLRDQLSRGAAAYVAPFVLYLVPTLFETQGWLGLGYEAVYTLKVTVVAAALWFFRREYPPVSTTGFKLAALVGAAGCAVWIALAAVQPMIPGLQQLLDYVSSGGRAGYDPFSSMAPVVFRVGFVIARLTGLVIAVPLMEEIFWRGFLARWLIADDFRSVPQGKMTTSSFWIVVLGFAAVHPEILAAIAWGILIGLVYHKTANLWACVVMHAVTNGLLGAYILTTGNWQLW